MEACGGAHH
jgi:transposase